MKFIDKRDEIANYHCLEDLCDRQEKDRCEICKEAYEQGYASGNAVAKAERILEQSKYRWHDLQKHPEDLPEAIPCGAGTAYSEALIVWTDNQKAITAIYDGKGFAGDAEFWEAERETIIAWKYVEPFKEE